MLGDLDPYQFEDFVGYVFEQAGFAVEDVAGKFGQGLDLRLHANSPDRRKYGVSVKHFTPPGNVTGPQMMLRRGALHNGLVGVAVTTGDYNGPALDEALKEPRMWALNRDQFIRYITYVRGCKALPMWTYPLSCPHHDCGERRTLQLASALREGRTHQALCGAGFDLACGFLHADRRGRDALVYDLMELARPAVDERVLAFLQATPFHAGDFTRVSDGSCRLHPQLARAVVATCGVPQQHLEGHVAWLAGFLRR
jgi:hypothetical protein